MIAYKWRLVWFIWGNKLSFTNEPELCVIGRHRLLMQFLMVYKDGHYYMYMKRSRARVTIKGQRVLLQISLQIIFFDFLLNSPESLKNIVKILGTGLQSSKNAQKWIKMVKFMMYTKLHSCPVFNSFFVFHFGA